MLNLTHTLDGADGLLGTALTLGSRGLTENQIAMGVSELQPLLSGSINRTIQDNNDLVLSTLYTKPNYSKDIWAKAIVSQTTLQPNQALLGLKSDNKGAIVGIDNSWGQGNLGVAFSHIQSDIDSKYLNKHSASTKTTQAIIYGDYGVSNATSVHAHLAVGRSDITGKRHIGVLTQGHSTSAKSDYKANNTHAGFEIRHQLGNDTRNITPFIGMSYAQVRSDAYQETDAGVYNLTVDKQRLEKLSTTAGLHFTQNIGSQLSLTGTLAGSINNGDQRSTIKAGFAHTPNSAFSIQGHKLGRTTGTASVGINYQLTPKSKLSAHYQGKWQKNYNEQGANIGINIQF